MRCPRSVLWWFCDPGHIVSSLDSCLTPAKWAQWYRPAWFGWELCDGSTPETPLSGSRRNCSPFMTRLCTLGSRPWAVPALRTVHCKQTKWRNGPPASQSCSGVDCARADDEYEGEDQALGSIGSFDFTALIVPTFLYSSLSWNHRASLFIPVCIFSLFFSWFHLYYSLCSVFLSFLVFLSVVLSLLLWSTYRRTIYFLRNLFVCLLLFGLLCFTSTRSVSSRNGSHWKSLRCRNVEFVTLPFHKCQGHLWNETSWK